MGLTYARISAAIGRTRCDLAREETEESGLKSLECPDRE